MPEATEIAVLHHELKTISNRLEKFEAVQQQLATMSIDILTLKNTTANHDRRIGLIDNELAGIRAAQLNMQSDLSNRIQNLRDELREHRYTGQTDILAKMDALIKTHEDRFKEKEDRIRALENWRWYIIGIMAAAGLVFTGIPWKIVFAQ